MTDQSSQDFETEFYGDKQLRWYQVAAINAVAQILEQGCTRVLIELPTGAGKTLTLAASLSDERIRQALGVPTDRPLRVLFAAHKHRLLTQAERTFTKECNVNVIPHSIFSDIPDDVDWDVTVLDESHHEACTTFQYQLERIGNKPIIGLTATPDRADGCLIKFEAIINPIDREQAVEEGYLAPTYLNTILDGSERNKLPITQSIVETYGHEFGNTMMFFRTKKEVREMTLWLQERGHNAIAILDQNDQEVDRILDDFSDGKIQFVVNCNKINEGVDVKNCTDVFLGRTYGSYPQLNQVIGRASRPDSDCRVWELVNPLSGRNLDTTVVVGTPERHRLISRRRGSWNEQEFNYVGQHDEIKSGISVSH